MTYKALSARDADAVVEWLRDKGGDDPTDADVPEPKVADEDGGDCDHSAIDAAAAIARSDWEAHRATLTTVREVDRQRLEARLAGHLHAVLKDVDVAVLSDMGFWRYLALFPYRWYLVAREPEMQPQDYGGTKPDKDNPSKRRGTDPKYQLLFRTFLWGKSAYDPAETDDPYRRATLVGATGGSEIDVWHSHMVRTQLGHLGRIAHHFIDSICEAPKANDVPGGRDVEKRLTRMKHNVLFDVYGDDGRSLVDDQKAAYHAAASAESGGADD